MLSKLVAAAEYKFGEVLATRQHPNGGHVLLIRRDGGARPEAPFMTIRGIVGSAPTSSADRREHSDFSWGNYDLEETEARQDFATR